MNRTEREKKAYDNDNVWESSHKWHVKFSHVFECPNTIRSEKIFTDFIKNNVNGKRVLDIGCGSGEISIYL